MRRERREGWLGVGLRGREAISAIPVGRTAGWLPGPGLKSPVGKGLMGLIAVINIIGFFGLIGFIGFIVVVGFMNVICFIGLVGWIVAIVWLGVEQRPG